jgi:hypothetical protein
MQQGGCFSISVQNLDAVLRSLQVVGQLADAGPTVGLQVAELAGCPVQLSLLVLQLLADGLELLLEGKSVLLHRLLERALHAGPMRWCSCSWFCMYAGDITLQTSAGDMHRRHVCTCFSMSSLSASAFCCSSACCTSRRSCMPASLAVAVSNALFTAAHTTYERNGHVEKESAQ